MNIDHLIQPLSSSYGPSGEDLSFSAEFDEIQEARRFDDPSLSQGEWVTEIKEADWNGVIQICSDLLGNRSKDLRLAAWLLEALCKREGLSGLAQGYELVCRLCQDFWPDIHPQPEGDDLEQRAGVLDWLANQTTRLIRETPITRSPKGAFSLMDLESARSLAKNIERNPGMTAELTASAHVTLELFEAAAKDTPGSFFKSAWQDVQTLKTTLLSLQTFLDEKMGELSPALGAAREALDDAERYFVRQGGNASQNVTGNTPMEGSPMPNPTAVAGAMPDTSTGGPIQTRAQAIERLHEVAAYFRRTEPHSPVAYLAEKAAKWGSMSLHEWLRSVVKDDGTLSHVQEMLGVEANNTDSN